MESKDIFICRKTKEVQMLRGGRWQRIKWGVVNEEYQAHINVNNNKIIL